MDCVDVPGNGQNDSGPTDQNAGRGAGPPCDGSTRSTRNFPLKTYLPGLVGWVSEERTCRCQGLHKTHFLS